MILAFFVHECVLEAGHTRAMLEVIRSLPKGSVSELHLIYYEGSTSQELFPNFDGEIIHHKIPLKGLFPFLFKALFFQVYSFFLISFKLPVESIKLGIGTACLNVDLVNIQFIQSQWKPLYFEGKSLFSLRTIYKKILFFYFELCENYLYRREDLKIMSLSSFVSSFLIEHFQVSKKQLKTIYSSTNLEHFPLPTRDKSSLLKELVVEYPLLSILDLNSAIFLFVGAFERKGLVKALSMLEELSNPQIIVIGKPESGKMFNFGEKIKFLHIPFTKKLRMFYELSDVFIFPTTYEPFGLVIAEAAAMGNLVLVPKKNVGASEILDELESVQFIDEKIIDLKSVGPITLEQKIKNATAVRRRLETHSWDRASKEFLVLLNLTVQKDTRKNSRDYPN